MRLKQADRQPRFILTPAGNQAETKSLLIVAAFDACFDENRITHSLFPWYEA
jgi:hypothetical protein